MTPRTMSVVPAWVEQHCIVPDGFRQGDPFRLYEGQLRWYANFYLVRGNARWVPEHPILAPAFVNSRGLLVGPQGWGKNPLIATQICVEGVGPSLFAGFAGPDEGYVCAEHGCRCGWEWPYEEGEPRGMRRPTPLIQITAFSEKSTDNTYDALRPMIDLGPLSDLIPDTGVDFIRLPGGGRIDTVTSSNQSRLGQRVTFVPQDELGLWTVANKMVKVADTQYRNLSKMGGRAALTTNAWDPSEHSVAKREFELNADDIYRQFVRPPANLSFFDKRERRKIYRIVYDETLVENGGHVDPDSIDAEAAKLVLKDPAQAERFYGNRLVPGSGAAVQADVWAGLARPGRRVKAGTRVALGFKGSIDAQPTILRGCTEDGFRFTIGFWDPLESGERQKVPRLEVKRKVRWAFDRFVVTRMNCEPSTWRTEVEEWAEEYGEDVVLAFETNSARRQAPAVDRWRTGIVEGVAVHDGDERITEHVEAAHLRKVHLADAPDDERTMYVLVPGDDGRSIAGAIADVLAFDAAMTMPEPEPENEPFLILGGRR